MPKFFYKKTAQQNELIRFSGIDIMRGLALISVATLHSGNGSPAQGLAAFLEHFSSFAVPFFLATSFYLASGKLYTSKASYSLQARLFRLLTPYGAWVLIYVVFMGLKYSVSESISQFPHFFHDPISIIFFGSPAYHLYFIPLLLTGTVLLKSKESLIQKCISLKILFVLLTISITLYEIIILTDNTFKLSSYVAFQALFLNFGLDLQQSPILRIVLVIFAWSLRCFPYVILACLLQHPSVQQRLPQWNLSAVIIACLLFLTVNIFGGHILPLAIYEIARGYTALIFAIALSAILKENALIKSLGLCSFGIYLMHLIWVEVLKTVLGRIFPILLTETTVLTLLTFSIPACLISWALTAFLIKRKGFLPKLLFGV